MRGGGGGQAASLLWRDVDEETTIELLSSQDQDERRRHLARVMQLSGDNAPDCALLNLYSQCLQFACEVGLTPPKVSTLLSLVRETHQRATAHYLTAMKSFDFFRTLLMRHAVHRPPYSVELFTLEDLKRITHFVTQTYFHNYRLFQYICTDRHILNLTTFTSYTEVPRIPSPLATATHTVDLGTKVHPEEDIAARAFREASTGRDVYAVLLEALNAHMEQLQSDLTRRLEAQELQLRNKLAVVEGKIAALREGPVS